MPSGFKDPTLPHICSSIFMTPASSHREVRAAGCPVAYNTSFHGLYIHPFEQQYPASYLGMPSLATTKVSWCFWFTVLTKVANFMEALHDQMFTVAPSAMIALPPEKPHRQCRAVLQTTSYLPIRPLRATNLQGKDAVHLLPEEISPAPAQTSEGLLIPTSMAPGYNILSLPLIGPYPSFAAFGDGSFPQGFVRYPWALIAAWPQ